MLRMMSRTGAAPKFGKSLLGTPDLSSLRHARWRNVEQPEIPLSQVVNRLNLVPFRSCLASNGVNRQWGGVFTLSFDSNLMKCSVRKFLVSLLFPMPQI